MNDDLEFYAWVSGPGPFPQPGHLSSCGGRNTASALEQRPVVHVPEVLADGVRRTIVTRVDGSSFVVEVAPMAMRTWSHRVNDGTPERELRMTECAPPDPDRYNQALEEQ